jgi:hypothetical protein
MKDSMGYDISGATERSVNTLEQGLHELRCYIGGPTSTVERALEESPALVMGYVLKAYLYLLGTEPAGLSVARTAHEAAQAFTANDDYSSPRLAPWGSRISHQLLASRNWLDGPARSRVALARVAFPVECFFSIG